MVETLTAEADTLEQHSQRCKTNGSYARAIIAAIMNVLSFDLVAGAVISERKVHHCYCVFFSLSKTSLMYHLIALSKPCSVLTGAL